MNNWEEVERAYRQKNSPYMIEQTLLRMLTKKEIQAEIKFLEVVYKISREDLLEEFYTDCVSNEFYGEGTEWDRYVMKHMFHYFR